MHHICRFPSMVTGGGFPI